ncbi:MAG: hypothetical protein EBV83_00795 [Verrucomicrobia bacterium]|nr:hypothetical protein [Verrucomicrobiota bacterium]
MSDPLSHVNLPASGITTHFTDEARAALAGYGEYGGMLLIGLATILSRRLREMNKKYVDAARV